MAFTDEEKAEIASIFETGFLSGMQKYREQLEQEEAAAEAANAANKPPEGTGNKAPKKSATPSLSSRLFGSLT